MVLIIMRKTDIERQRDRRARMYEAGYKQKNIWVPIDSEREGANLERGVFIRRITALTAGWSKTKLNRFYKEVLKIMKEKIEEDES